MTETFLKSETNLRNSFPSIQFLNYVNRDPSVRCSSWELVHHITFDLCLSSDFQKFFKIFWSFLLTSKIFKSGIFCHFLTFADISFVPLGASFYKISHQTFICQLFFESFFRNFLRHFCEDKIPANAFIYWILSGDLLPATAQLR